MYLTTLLYTYQLIYTYFKRTIYAYLQFYIYTLVIAGSVDGAIGGGYYPPKSAEKGPNNQANARKIPVSNFNGMTDSGAF